MNNSAVFSESDLRIARAAAEKIERSARSQLLRSMSSTVAEDSAQGQRFIQIVSELNKEPLTKRTLKLPTFVTDEVLYVVICPSHGGNKPKVIRVPAGALIVRHPGYRYVVHSIDGVMELIKFNKRYKLRRETFCKRSASKPLRRSRVASGKPIQQMR